MSRPVVLNTRPREQAAELSRRLDQAGFRVVEAPAIAIVAAWDPAELETVCRELEAGAFAWAVLPSRNASHGLLPALLRTRVVCGVATARALGLTAYLELAHFSAAAALEALRDRVSPGQRVLVPRAAEGRDELIDGLRGLGADVCARIAYRTLPVDDAASRLRAGNIDVIVLCSPSAVTSLKDSVQSWTRVVCLGETTASAARAAGLRVDRVARTTTMAALVDAVDAATAEVRT
jgi:uroporphyrinogen-III synthase/uroporphyrinogen III methyltransferase/synthase